MNMKERTRKRRRLQGVVLSHAAKKTAIVGVERIKVHQKYHKRYTVSKKYKAHDEKDSFSIGDKVIMEECRPISKEKKWRIVGKVERNKG